MSFKYIQDYYGVPAKRGQRVKHKDKLGTITSAHNQYIKIRWDGEKKAQGVYHPTDEIEYLATSASDVPATPGTTTIR